MVEAATGVKRLFECSASGWDGQIVSFGSCRQMQAGFDVGAGRTTGFWFRGPCCGSLVLAADLLADGQGFPARCFSGEGFVVRGEGHRLFLETVHETGTGSIADERYCARTIFDLP